MDFMIMVLVGVMCMYTGVKILSSEEQNKVFNKYHLEVTDVKKYNQYCGWLAIGFGIAASLTLYIGSLIKGWIGSLFSLALIGEAAVVLLLYRKIEAKLAKNGGQIKRRNTKSKKTGVQKESAIEKNPENETENETENKE